MSVELLYTSAVQGLKQGSRGFCTVISTAGMPINLATRLEGLSAYRHIYPPNHPDAAKNPVNFSHLRINVGGRTISILSRVADYGIDYSQRTNKLAHHVVVEAHEQTPAGPAWLMQSTSILRSRWDGQCATPASGPTIPMQDQAGKICTTWKSLSGDAGWGGVVADTFASAVGKPLWIIYDLGQREQLLTLLNEAIALLPYEKRWSATFSTYATNVPPDADCKVRCVPAGSDDARLAPAMGKVIDLTKKQSVPAVTELVTAAREGIVFSPKPVPSAPRPIAVETPQVHSTTRQPDVSDFELVEDDFEMKLKPIGPPSVNSSQLPPSPRPAVRSRPNPQPNYAQLAPDTPDSNSWMKWALIGASVTIVCLMIAIGGLVYTKKVNEKLELARVETAKAEAEKEAAVQKLEEEREARLNSDEKDGPVKEAKQDELKSDDTVSKSSDVDLSTDVSAAPASDAIDRNKGQPAVEDPVESKVTDSTEKKEDSGQSSTPSVLNGNGQMEVTSPSNSNDEVSDQSTVYAARINVSELVNGRFKLTIQLVSPFDHKVNNAFSQPEGGGPLSLDKPGVLLRDDKVKQVKIMKVDGVEPFRITVEFLPDENERNLATKTSEHWNTLSKKISDWNRRPTTIKIPFKEPEGKVSFWDFRKGIRKWKENYDVLVTQFKKNEDDFRKQVDAKSSNPEVEQLLNKMNQESQLLKDIDKLYHLLEETLEAIPSTVDRKSELVLFLSTKPSAIESGTSLDVADERSPFGFLYRIEPDSNQDKSNEDSSLHSNNPIQFDRKKVLPPLK